MKTLSDVDLALVTGGKASPSANIAGSGGGSSNNDQVLGALQSIESSLKDLGKTNGLFGGNNGILFMAMALALGRRNDVVVYGGGCRRGFWRSW